MDDFFNIIEKLSLLKINPQKVQKILQLLPILLFTSKIVKS